MSLTMLFLCFAPYVRADQFNDYMVHSGWKQLKSLPNEMAYIIGGVYNDEIRVLGGYISKYSFIIDSTVQQFEYRSTIQYTPSDDTLFALSPWTSYNLSSTLPLSTVLGSDTQQYTTINNSIYIMGTNDRSQFQHGEIYGELIIYNMETQLFASTDTYNSIMIVPLAGNCITTNNVYLFSIGGYDARGTNTVNFIRYNINNDEWSIGPDLNEARYSAQCAWAELNNHLYVFGGYANSVEWLDLKDNQAQWQINWNTPWNTIGTLSSYAHVIDSELIYFTGGRFKDNGQTLTALSTPAISARRDGYLFNISNHEWVADIIQYDLTEGAIGFASVSYQPVPEYQCIFNIGGFTDTVQYNCMETTLPTTQVPTGTSSTQSPTATPMLSDIDSSHNTETEISPHNSASNDPKTTSSSSAVIALIILVLIIIGIFGIIYFIKRKKNKPKLVLKNPLVILIGIGKYNSKFKKSGDPRINGTLHDLPIHIDLNNLSELFAQENYNYTVLQEFAERDQYKLSWTQDELAKYLDSKAHYLKRNMDKFDGLILVISGHGIEGGIPTSDYKVIEMIAIHRIFSLNHTEVRKLPRIFIYDCCNGNNVYGKGVHHDNEDENSPVQSIVTKSNDRKSGYTEIKQDAMDEDEEVEEKDLELNAENKPFCYKDFEARQDFIWAVGDNNPDYSIATVFAATEGFESLAHKDKGSYMIRKFVEKMMRDLRSNQPRYVSEIFYEIQEDLKEMMQIKPTFNNCTRYIQFCRNAI